MKKLVLVGALTLAAANVMAVQGTSSIQISNATVLKINDTLATKPSQTNTAGTAAGVTDTTDVSGQGISEDGHAAYKNVKSAVVKTANFLVVNVSEPVKASVLGAVNTLEYTGNGATVGTTGMAGATGADSTAVAETKPSQTNTAGTAAGVTDAQTLAATGGDTVASGAFSSNPAEQVRKFKKLQEDKKQAVHAAAVQVLQILIQVGPTSAKGIAQLAELGDYAADLSGVKMANDEARVRTGLAFVKGALAGQQI